MEKMQLGSPASPAQSGYLPNFLFETPNNHARSFTNSPTASPDFGRSGLQQKFQSPSQNYSSMNQSSLQQQQQQLYQAQNQNANNNNSISGPPINSLFDNIRNEKSFQTPTKNFYQSQIVHHDTPIGTVHHHNNTSGFNQSRIMSPIPHTTTTEFNNSYTVPQNNHSINDYSRFNLKEEASKNYFVTVFGFSNEALHLVLSHFSSCGTILEKVCSEGNWLHLRFSSRAECDKALLYNGKVIGNSLMIGVIRCNDESVIEKENREYPQTPIGKIRSLTQASYLSAKNETQVVPGNEEPKKSTGIVNKAMDLIFGW